MEAFLGTATTQGNSSSSLQKDLTKYYDFYLLTMTQFHVSYIADAGKNDVKKQF